MAQYIDKSAIMAMIDEIYNETNYEPFTDEVLGKRNVCRKITDFLNTLEVKEVDSDKTNKIDNRPVTERIKTFEDAYKALDDEHPLVTEYQNVVNVDLNITQDLFTYLKLRIIVAALNDGWEPKFEKDENRYYPWFYFYTKEQYDKLDDEEKGRCVLRFDNNTYLYASFVSCYADYVASYSYTDVGSRFAFKTRELAIYAGTQFIQEWHNFIFKI